MCDFDETVNSISVVASLMHNPVWIEKIINDIMLWVYCIWKLESINKPNDIDLHPYLNY